MYRVLFFIAIVIIAVTGPVFLLAAFALGYALMYRAYELVLVAVCIDAYFGTGEIPYYLLVSTVAIIAIELLKPHVHVRERTI